MPAQPMKTVILGPAGTFELDTHSGSSRKAGSIRKWLKTRSGLVENAADSRKIWRQRAGQTRIYRTDEDVMMLRCDSTTC